jgi:hypothetical protein
MFEAELQAKIQETRKLLEALELLAQHYKAGSHSPLQSVQSNGKRPPVPPVGSIRDRVLKETTDYVTVKHIADKTGLDMRQVRGVITAPDLKEHFEKRDNHEGVTEYRFAKS